MSMGVWHHVLRLLCLASMRQSATTRSSLAKPPCSPARQAIELDHKLRLSERATAASTAIKESAVGRSTTAALGKVGSALGAGTRKVLENDKVGGCCLDHVRQSRFRWLWAALHGI